MAERVRVMDPAQIEKVLAEVRQASLEMAGPERPAVRATVLNLVVFAGNPAAAADLASVAAALADRHPSRTILIGTAWPAGDEEWTIEVWARCHRAPARYVVCFEGIEIMAREEALERVPALILPLLLRDLPVVLWWPGDVPTRSPLFLGLLANADRLVADSASAPAPEALLSRLAGLVGLEQCQCTIGDLDWHRLTPWRELTARLFDPPDSRSYLQHVERVLLDTVEQPGRPDATQAYLYTAWLATRLGWTPAAEPHTVSAGGERLNLLRGREAVTVELARLPLAEGTRGLRRVLLQASHPEGEASLAIRRSADGTSATLTTVLPGRPPRQHAVRYREPDLPHLLSEELGLVASDPVYAEALRLAALLSAPPAAGELG
ncbi:MAG: glucose-6-phosphate dehydrogenase assembly protein OpcA [Anaerolineae bacterium]|nr:glucose-6-phosphate dehydrogenase assembly protein OpcA [Anaerolineae bacterium]